MELLTAELKDVFCRVLDGDNYGDASAAIGWSRRITKTRVEQLARSVQQVVGVVGVDDNAQPSLELLSMHSEAYREALGHYVPDRAVPQRGCREADATDLERVLAAIAQRRRCCARDTAMVLTLFATGAKPREIGALLVADYLHADGTIRAESRLRADAAFNGIERPLYFVNQRTCQAIDAYLAERLRARHHCGADAGYRGLAPASPLFLRQDGQFFADGEGPEKAATVHNLFHRLMKLGAREELSTLSARRAVASRLRRRGIDLDTIASVLGLESKDSARRLLPDHRPPVGDAMRELF